MKQKKNASDFRYNTGKAKIPWNAVGEHLGANDVFEIVKLQDETNKSINTVMNFLIMYKMSRCIFSPYQLF